MDEQTLERAKRHIAEAREGRDAARLEGLLDRSRAELERLAATAGELEAALPARIGEAVQEGFRREVATVGRNLAEIRGLLNNAIRRLERLEDELLAERHARIDDLALIVDLVSTGWGSVHARLAHLEPERNGESPAAVLPLAADAAA
jgi:hypothetical protein